MTFTTADLIAMEERLARGRKQSPEPAVVDACERESDLHDQTSAELTRRRLYHVHSRMDRAATNGIGTPDYIVAMPDGKTIWLELKTRTGKLTAEQQTAKHLLDRSGHTHHIVRSFRQLLEILGTANGYEL